MGFSFKNNKWYHIFLFGAGGFFYGSFINQAFPYLINVWKVEQQEIEIMLIFSCLFFLLATALISFVKRHNILRLYIFLSSLFYVLTVGTIFLIEKKFKNKKGLYFIFFIIMLSDTIFQTALILMESYLIKKNKKDSKEGRAVYIQQKVSFVVCKIINGLSVSKLIKKMFITYDKIFFICLFFFFPFVFLEIKGLEDNIEKHETKEIVEEKDFTEKTKNKKKLFKNIFFIECLSLIFLISVFSTVIGFRSASFLKKKLGYDDFWVQYFLSVSQIVEIIVTIFSIKLYKIKIEKGLMFVLLLTILRLFTHYNECSFKKYTTFIFTLNEIMKGLTKAFFYSAFIEITRKVGENQETFVLNIIYSVESYISKAVSGVIAYLTTKYIDKEHGTFSYLIFAIFGSACLTLIFIIDFFYNKKMKKENR